MEQRYTIGLDFGSLSCRGVLVRMSDGETAAEAEFVYPHGVLYDSLPTGEKLPPLWALQDPRDHLDALEYVIPSLLHESGLPPEAVAGLGVDTTASTVIPVSKDLTPLCIDPAWANCPHAWPKMWKHHAAKAEAEELTRAAQGLPALERCGGAVGSEFLLPKVLQVLREAPEIFNAAETFFELGDWLVSLLTGREVRSGMYLACKSLWDPGTGYPKGPLFDPLTEKLAFHGGVRPVIVWPGQCAGAITSEMACRLGLSPGAVISAAQSDAYAGFPGSGGAGPGTLAMVLGTSNAYLLVDEERRSVPGICAAVPDSILSGFTGYAAGQASTGDIFKWFTENCVPASYEHEAQKRGEGLHAYLTHLASARKPGESGLIALDWWNGNKSVLNNSGLSGMILGLSLTTKPEDIYRALIEATAYGARRILEAFLQSGIEIHTIIASGGIASKNPLLMQIYADVLGMPVAVSPCAQTAALGSAMYAAAAVGAAAGGYSTVTEAVASMCKACTLRYRPDPEAQRLYLRLYAEYLTLHNYFGDGGNQVMERLRSINETPDTLSRSIIGG